MARRLHALTVLVAVLIAVCGAGVAAPAPPSAADLLAIVETLTAPEMAGRRSGTDGGDRAARHLAQWLAGAGLRPGGDDGGFFQSFVVGTERRRGGGSVLTADGRRVDDGEWTPHGGSRIGSARGRLAFAGYGVRGDRRDDYAGLDVRDAVVLVLDGAPDGERGTRLEKLVAARRLGARGVLVVADSLPPLSATAASVDLLSATVTPRGADALLAPVGTRVETLRAAVAERGAAASFVGSSEIAVTVDVRPDARRAVNVLGILPGTDPALAREAIVLGAHYDHLGVVGGVVHPGADDNASGTAVVVGLARAFAAAGGVPRTLVFALFGGEEIGLVGSGHYVANPAIPIDRTVAMLNFDMVGRLREGGLRVGGVDSGTRLRRVARAALDADAVPADVRGAPFAPSDHARFYAAGAPVVFLHTGTHADYHRPGDTADKLDADGMARVAAVGAAMARTLAGGERPVYAKIASPTRSPGREHAVGAARPFLGIAGDRGAPSDGAVVGHVVAGSAAQRAGLRDGDVIMRLGGTAVNSFEELRAAIVARQPGDVVDVVYLRDGRDHATSATLERSTE